jgi:hypothetical protein
MYDYDNDFDVRNIADAFGFFEAMADDERAEDSPGDPSPSDTLKTDLDYLDEED